MVTAAVPPNHRLQNKQRGMEVMKIIVKPQS